MASAVGHRAVGQFHAAIDACYLALAIAPADPGIHLALAELYLDVAGGRLAADKLVLLGRLAELDRRHGDAGAAVRPGRPPLRRTTPRLAALCA